MTSDLTRRRLLSWAGGGVVATALLAACGSSSSSSTSTSTSSTSASSSASSAAASGPPNGGQGGGPCGGQAEAADATVTALLKTVKPLFKQHTYTDATTKLTIPYNLFLPTGYSSSEKYPIIMWISDSRFPGQGVTAPLSQYGALIWASPAEQAKHKAIVVVPQYPKTIIDDQNGAKTITPYVDMTARMLTTLQSKYSVDPTRVYATGQSMGALTTLYLASRYPTLFTAEFFVSGQWYVDQLTDIKSQKFVYTAAGSDNFAHTGQLNVEKLLKADGVPFGTATWDATWSTAKLAAAAKTLLADGDHANFATFKSGTVAEAAGGSSNTSGNAGEHLLSFEPAYKNEPLRDWLFVQRS